MIGMMEYDDKVAKIYLSAKSLGTAKGSCFGRGLKPSTGGRDTDKAFDFILNTSDPIIGGMINPLCSTCVHTLKGTSAIFFMSPLPHTHIPLLINKTVCDAYCWYHA